MMFNAAYSAHARRHGGLLISTPAIASGTYPVTMACWLSTNHSAYDAGVMSLGTSGSSDNYIAIMVSSTRAVFLRSRTTFNANTTALTLSANRWYHIVGVFGSGSHRALWVDGKLVNENTTFRGPTWNQTSLFAISDAASPVDGWLVWPSFWESQLSFDEIRQLAMGARPDSIRPQSLRCFLDFKGGANEISHNGDFSFPESTTRFAPGLSMLKAQRPYLYGAGYVAGAATGNRRRRLLIAGSR